MLFVTLILANLVGASLVNYVESKKNIIAKNKSHLMGTWPYNLVILLGVLGLLLAEQLPEGQAPFLIAIAVFSLTAIFYVVVLTRLAKRSKNDLR